MATTLKLPNVIEPNKLILEDFEIISFEKEEDLDYYSLWHDKFRGKSFDDLVQPRARPKRPPPKQQQQQPPSKQQKLQEQPQRQQQPKVETEPVGCWPDANREEDEESRQQNQHQKAQPHSRSSQLSVQSEPKPQNKPELTSHLHTTVQDGKVLMKYKLTKLYNKLRGRQMRRNIVVERQTQKRLEAEIAKGQLNSWLAYTALQALRLPESNVNQLSTIAISNTPKFITIPQPVSNANSADSSKAPSSKKKSSKKAPQSQAQPAPAQAPPLHYVYLDPNDIVTYSNRICPQQIVSYRKRSHLLPSSATSKKSSAASYDAYEIMEVLANSDNTNVTITRNANKPAPVGCSIYSHSINNNTKTPGIVSTQLHLQARSYLDTVARFYSEEATRLAEEEERLRNEPSIEEQISKYIKIKDT